MRGIFEYKLTGVRECPTQTVAELIEFLSKKEPGMLVCFVYDGNPLPLNIAHTDEMKFAGDDMVDYPETMLTFDV